MSEGLTRNAARNIFYGGSAIFFLIFAGLTLHTNYYMANTSTAKYELSESVIKGKEVWEEHSCINCHTIMGEGAYFGPELSNVWHRYGGRENPAAARAGIKGWMKAQPTGAPGRRQMPQFNISDENLDHLVDFFRWVDGIKTHDWPPHKSG